MTQVSDIKVIVALLLYRSTLLSLFCYFIKGQGQTGQDIKETIWRELVGRKSSKDVRGYDH